MTRVNDTIRAQHDGDDDGDTCIGARYDTLDRTIEDRTGRFLGCQRLTFTSAAYVKSTRRLCCLGRNWNIWYFSAARPQ